MTTNHLVMCCISAPKILLCSEDAYKKFVSIFLEITSFQIFAFSSPTMQPASFLALCFGAHHRL